MNNPYKPNDLIINYLGDYNKPKTNPINYNISNESIYDEHKSNISNNFMESRDTIINNVENNNNLELNLIGINKLVKPHDSPLPPMIPYIITNDLNRKTIYEFINNHKCHPDYNNGYVISIDSGASSNITGSLKNLCNVRDYHTNMILPTKEKEIVQVSKIGDLTGYINNIYFIIKNVLYSEDINENKTLISFNYLKRQYIADVIIIDNNAYFRLAKLNGQLLCIEKENSIKFCNIYENSKQGNHKTIYSLQSNNLDQYSLSIWHKRLYHFYNNNLIKFLNGHTINKTLYIGCKISKLKKEPFRKTLNARSTRPLELIHSDIIGPLKESRNNFKYILTFLDDFTRKSWIYLLKRKSEVPEIFENFIRMVTNESNLTITKIQSDNGKEYTQRNS